ncbi:polysaccharide deacetylase family protein [Caldimonas brevitalea]|uniref:Polysaccharide deacetylase family protein n=1 Tax=Caldimonas brevitalea TaxID=413882 RepID=A0A0G3BJ13_9BURK|nr:polysaccharide deacetylase family protein [Caldimonas brevitalea]AKJ29357.1 polysaccharide deacetylase family protein [Caldimonas brevitalea]
MPCALLACRRLARLLLTLTLAGVMVAGCASRPPIAPGQVLARNDRFVLYQPMRGETLRSIAELFLGDAEQHWVIGDFNGITRPSEDLPLAVPLKPVNRAGVHGDHYQTVPILCYHRFGYGGGKMNVSPARFAAQLDWLARHGYHVLRLDELAEYLEGRRAVPRRSVVITVDDGYESFYRYAAPLLRRHGFPVTLFVYTDFVGAGDAVDWSQLRELAASGLVDIQPHSKTHRNLSERGEGESEEAYRQALQMETAGPRELLERRLKVKVRHYAYPYGDANEAVLETLERHKYRLAVTVNPGGNAFFAQPLLLRRSMVQRDDDLEDFKAKLQVTRGFKAP